MRNASGYKDPTAGAALAGGGNITAPNKAVVRVSLPLPPSVNHYYFTDRRTGKRLMTEEVKAWMELAKIKIKEKAQSEGWRLSNGHKVVVKIWAYWPDNRRRDMHNMHKALGDAPQDIIYTDDKDALLRDMDFKVDRKNPRVELEFLEFREGL